MPNDHEMLKEIHRLTLENNKLLRGMRRSAFISRVLTLLVYAALIILPLWFYLQYMAPIVDQMFQTMEQLQGTGAQASAQFDSLQAMWQQLQERFAPSQ